jgi:site-specific recombinase XerD
LSGSRRNAATLAPFVDSYGSWLAQQGYSSAAATRSLTTLGHLGRWMEDHGVAVDQLAEHHVAGFVARYRIVHGHLPASSARPILEFLRASGVAGSSSPVALSPVEQVLSEYRRWLIESRGLAEATVRGREQIARQFLLGRVTTDDPRGVLGITGAELNRFLVLECGRVSDASAVAYTGRLRSLLRFLAARGLADPGLEQAVPRVARWRQATVPQVPTRPDVEQLLSGCDRGSVAPARDRAVLLLLARLGLRAIEVSRLELRDLDWPASEICVDGKGHQCARLPLPAEVADALIAHLRCRGRYPGQTRVFLSAHAPIRPLEASGVRTIVRNACRRAGIERVAAHQLRHALASDLLRAGASMPAVGQVLRHRSLESTAIYAKVDLERLRLAAASWPGATR